MSMPTADPVGSIDIQCQVRRRPEYASVTMDSEKAVLDALAPEFARSLLARCPAATGCPANIPSWEPWTSLAVASILRAPPATVDAPTRASLAALLELTLARFSRAREQVASAPSPALAPWLLAAGELQR